jgi:ribosome biogenesis GTPase
MKLSAEKQVEDEKAERNGLVMRSTGSWYEVMDTADRVVVSCRIQGKLKILGERSTNPIAVGDYVLIQMQEKEKTGLITERLKRRNSMVRKSVNLSKETHVVAANLDHAFLIATVVQPATSTGFMDRFLVSAQAYRVPVTIIFNKVDVCVEGSPERAQLEYLEGVYEKAGIPTLRTSAKTGEGLDRLSDELASAGVNLLSGHSGVGKSTLINSLMPGTDLRTGEVSDAHQKGKHTTTFAEMFPLPAGGFIIDTPGIKGFGLVHLERNHLHHYFPEIFERLDGCKFHNCLHRNEPHCAVIKAVENGEIAEERYLNYIELYETFESNSYR